ncbi:MAG: YfhO family protein, partial [Clostridia bacterium]|nr:YfhO family protein [Clostridia bacterium]
MVVNYYIGYMVVLFTLLYFGIVIFSLSVEGQKQVAIRFLTASFIAALLT